MLANDLAPNRLTRAKLAAEDLIAQLGGDRVGLIAFAGSSFLQAPLTADHGAVLTALHELDPDIIPRGGTNIADAIRTAVEAFGKGESDNRALVIFTDGEELDTDGIKVAKEQEEIARIYTVGVGSTKGHRHRPARARRADGIREGCAGADRQIATGRGAAPRDCGSDRGFYLQLRNAPAEMRQLFKEGIAAMSEKEINAEFARQPIERYQWPLAAGIALLIASMFIGDRKNTTARKQQQLAKAALWAGLLLSGGALNAAEAPHELYEQGRYKEAQEAYEEMLRRNPNSDRLAFNHGAAAYKNKDFKSALESFGKAVASDDRTLRARAEYNLGNTLFQQATSAKKEPDIKTLESALSHFDQAQQLDVEDANAKHNYDVTKQLIEQLKQQQQEQQKKEEQEKKDQKQDQKDQQQQQQSQGRKDDKQKQEQQQSKGDQQDQQQKEQQSGDQKQEQGQKGQQDKQQSEGDQKDQKGEKGEQEKQQNAEGGQKDQRDKKQQSQDAQSEQQQGKEGEQSNQQQMPEQENRKLEGDLKTDPAPGEESKEAQEQKEAAEQELAAAEGRMTEAQAKALLDSLKDEDRKVRLLDPQGRRQRERPLRDW